MKVPITQSEEWHKLQQDLNQTSFYISNDDYTYVAILKNTPAGNYLYCPYGPCYDGSDSFKKALQSLQEIAASNKAIFIRVEPQDANFIDYKPANTQKSTDLNPKETWLLDLKGTDEELNSRLPSRLLRYYRAATKKGITIKSSHNPSDIKHLLSLQKALALEKGISTFSEHYLATELSQPFASLYLAEYNDPTTNNQEIVATGLVFDDKTTRYNLQGAQNEQGRKLHATGILTIQLIYDAKAKNLETFDFWGIAPAGAGPDHPWAGFTNFKKTFAGIERDYAGTYDIILSPAKYKLYQASRKINRFIRRAK